ncbi:DUF4190 domain-containing protein [Microbacterium horticulturae]|uniref:DUF4190 domain-containing protein n=1 Tax=Microbacterium horticulturae TaxID=3028316 RepID=A0ABY8BV85_9MICO|nr:DUF4190 domain-containing protein [Microbacterium sp. KACC 23027]WEG07752.1 DUF4190 domain-containing protein [Microbacterium sp. KACC 23027]
MSDPQNPEQPQQPGQSGQPQQPEQPPTAPPAPEPPAYAQAPTAGEAPYGQAPAYGAGYPQAPAYGQPAPSTTYPGKTMGIVAFILSLVGLVTSGLGALIGLILGIVALSQSKKAGQKNGLALAAIIIGAIVLVLTIIGLIVLFSFLAAVAGAAQQCVTDPNTVVQVWGFSFPCASSSY